MFGFVGPSVVLDTACSSSLVAVHLAQHATARVEAVSAYAAGVQCTLLSGTFSVLNNLNALSPDGRCKTFDIAADGYGRGEAHAAIYTRLFNQSTSQVSKISTNAFITLSG